jgi:hypothetical protein
MQLAQSNYIKFMYNYHFIIAGNNIGDKGISYLVQS